MPPALQQLVSEALDRVVNRRTGMSVVRAEQVRDVATTLQGHVRLTLLLSASDDATLARDVRQAIEGVEGVREVRVDIKPDEGAAPAATGSGPASQPRRAPLPMLEQPAAAPRVSAPTPVAMPNLGRIIAVSSGKGGVGKSTVTVNIAVALARLGKSVGLMDADIYGPNIPRMMGVNAPPEVEKEKIIPLEAHGVKVISLGFLIERDQPAIWRGPIVMKIITQFLRDVRWGKLDYLLVDMPPGTGDAQLSLVQATNVSGAIIVTTPQEVAVGDALRGAKMFERVGVPIIGVVENMSWFDAGPAGRLPIFGAGGGTRLAAELGVKLLGEVPLHPPVLQGGDAGTPIVVSDPGSAAATVLTAIAEGIAKG